MKKYSLLFFAIMFLIGTDSFLISPLLPTLVNDFHITTASSGWLVSVYAIGFALFTLVAGPLSDRLDRKKVIISGLIAFAITTLLCSIASNFWEMLAFRFLAGVAASFVTPQVWASVPRVAEPQDRMKLMGIVMSGLAGANLAGVPIGSFLAVHSWHLPFIVVGGASLLLIAAILLFLPSMPPVKTAQNQSIRQLYGSVLNNHQALRYVLAFGLIFVGSPAIFSFLGTWLTKDFHLGLAAIGVAMLFVGAGQFIGGMFGNRLTERLGHQRYLALAFVSWLILFLILPFMPDVLLATLVTALIFLLMGMSVPVIVATIQNTQPEARGTMSSLSNFALYTGQAIGVAIAGGFYSHFPGFFGVSALAFIAFVLSALCFLWAGFWRERKNAVA